MADAWSWLSRGSSATEALIRELDWSATPVGAVETWPASLKTIVAMMLHSKHPMFLWWGPELVQFYNDAYVPSFGVGRHPEAMGQRGRDCWGEIWSIIGPQIDDVMQRAVPTYNVDALVPITRNGRLEEVYWTYGYSPVFDADGKVAGTLVVVTETTARVVLARRLRAARALADALAPVLDAADLDTATMATFAQAPEDQPWALVYRARAAACSVGLDADQQRAIVALLERRDPNALELDVSSVAPINRVPWPEPSVRAVVLPLSADGYLVIGLTPRLPLDADYEDYLHGLARQLVSAGVRVGALHARMAAESNRNDLLMQAPVAAALLVGPTWRFKIANERYEQLVGRKVVGGNWRELFPELVGGPVDQILESVYTEGKTFFASEQSVPLVRESDGIVEDRFFDFNMMPIRDARGAVEAMMVIAVELTAQVRSRRELERTAEERERLLGDLETANRSKDLFLAMLGHELRNPLAPIVTALDLMNARGEPASERERAVIGRQVSHLVSLVDDLLDVSKVASGKIELRRTASSVGDILGRAIELASELLERRQHYFRTAIAGDLVWNGDATRLAQVVANLLTNAARYTDPGGHIELAAARDGDQLVIRVSDDGRGIDAALLPRIFDAFVQAERTIDRREGGLGLGLALVKGLVALHHGTVEAHSDGHGHGSEFVVRVPGLLAPGISAVPLEPAHAIASHSSRAGKRVLVIDDNVDAATMLAEILGMAGHVTALAHDGPAALALLDRFVPEVAIVDIGLPVMDGYEVAKQLRDRLRGTCEYIALTGYGQQSDRARSAAAGFDRHLVKPINTRELVSLLADE